jgi:hypothetical protein
LIDCINDMARRFLGVGQELTMTATGGGNDADNLTRAQADQIDVSTGIRTRNEIRAERGIPLIDEPEADELGVTAGAGVSFLQGTLKAQQAQQAQSEQGPPQQAPQAPQAGEKTNDTAGADAAKPDGTAGTAQPVDKPGSSATSSGNAGTSSSGSAEGSGKTKSSVKPKDDPRLPETDAEKELTVFAKFAKARMGRDKWRDFEFEHVPTYKAVRLNAIGRTGDQDAMRHAIAKAAGDPEALIEWYNEGADGQIEWGSPGDFDACVGIASKYMDDDQAKGFCNLRHQDAVGGPPGSEDATKGDVAGHSFHGNQWSAAISGSNLDSSDGKTVSLGKLKAGDHVVYQNTIHEYIGRQGGEHWARPIHAGGGAGELTSLGQTSAGPLSDRAGIFRVNPDAVDREKRTQKANKADYEELISERSGEPRDKDLYDKVIEAAKRKFDVYPSAVANGWVVQEYKRRGGDYRKPVKKAEADSFTPPKSVQEEAQRALDWLEQDEQGDGFTDVGRKRASDLAAGHAVSLDTIKRMASYLARHRVDEQGEGWSPGDDGYPSPGRVAWAAWGGDAASSWVNGILEGQADKAAESDVVEELVAKMVGPEIERLRATYGLLGQIRSII